jgi:hypothetical protein
MQTTLKRITLIILAGMLISLASPAFADKVSTDIGLAGVGARPLGMGKAYTAVADDSNALFLNPAGLAFQNNWELTSLSTRLLDNVDYKMVGGVYKLGIGTVGVGYITTSLPAGFTATTENVGGVDQIIPLLPVNYHKDLVYVSFGCKVNDGIRLPKNFGELSFGTALKVQSQNFGGAVSEQAAGYDADVALLWKLNPDFSLGLNAQNILSASAPTITWSTGEKEKNANLLKLGGAYRPNSRLLIALDTEFSPAGKTPLLIHTGAEFKPVEFISFRAGIDQNPLALGNGGYSVLSNLTAGVGLDYQGIRFDYAYHQDPESRGNAAHYISISISGRRNAAPAVTAAIPQAKAGALSSARTTGIIVMNAPEDLKQAGLKTIRTARETSILEYYK